MTLQNGLVHGGSAFLWCDTAFFDTATGKLVALDSKAMQGLYWPWAGIMASNGGIPHTIARDIGEAWPSDVPSLLAATIAALRSYAAQGYSARVLLAAYEDRPQLWLVGTDDCTGEGAFVPCEASHYLAFGNDLPEYRRAVSKGLTPKRMANIIDAQIAQPFELAGSFASAGKRVWVGGAVVETKVSRAGVESRVLRAVDGGMVNAVAA